MKRLFFIAIALISVSRMIEAQTDYQWYILNGMGRDGINFSNMVTSRVTIDSINLPSTSTTVTPKDNIFLIWSDWTHYNSRFVANPNFVYNPPHFYINSANEKSIRYLYWSNIYDDNGPPPRKLKVINGNSALSTNIFTPTTSYPSSGHFYANHNAIPTTDQVLIIPYNLFLSKPFQLSFALKHGPATTTIPNVSQYIALQPVFPAGSTGSSAFSHGMATYNNNIIDFTPAVGLPFPQYVYVALKMKDSLSFLLSGNPTPDSLLYSLSMGSRTLATGIEPINDSDDPNEIIATEFDTLNGKYYVQYKGEFFNSSMTVPANKLRFGFTIGRSFDGQQQVHINSITHKGVLITPTAVNVNPDGVCEVILPEDVSIIHTSLEAATIKFEFYIGPFNEGVINGQDSLISNAYTRFGIKQYKMAFKDQTYRINGGDKLWSKFQIGPVIRSGAGKIEPLSRGTSFCETIKAYFHIDCWLLLLIMAIIFALAVIIRRRRG